MIENICLSGGAIGADTLWGDAARHKGHQVIHFIFDGHRSQCHKHELYKLSREDLLVADPVLAEVNRDIVHRKWPVSNPYTADLLRRNYYQVRETSSVYAVSTFERGFVAGGTAWAVAMAIYNDIQKIFVFDQEKNVWTSWDGEGFEIINRPPSPHGVWTGIGTRYPNSNGVRAINDVFEEMTM